MKDLKTIYLAPTEEATLVALDEIEEKRRKKYPSSGNSWRNNWPQLPTYLKYPGGIRKIIHSTNAIENFNCGLRKVTKAKSHFPSDDGLFKSIYLSMIDITKKWTGTLGIRVRRSINSASILEKEYRLQIWNDKTKQ